MSLASHNLVKDFKASQINEQMINVQKLIDRNNDVLYEAIEDGDGVVISRAQQTNKRLLKRLEMVSENTCNINLKSAQYAHTLNKPAVTETHTMTTMTKEKLHQRTPEVLNFVAEIHERKGKWLAFHCPNLEQDDISIQVAIKFIKIWQNNNLGQRSSIIAFINRETGDIFKPASTKAPAKHARGNVFEGNGVSALTCDGSVVYR